MPQTCSESSFCVIQILSPKVAVVKIYWIWVRRHLYTYQDRRNIILSLNAKERTMNCATMNTVTLENRQMRRS